MFLRNYWYVAAWDHEVSRKPLDRIILNEPLVLFRKEDGTPVAFEDRCCHRRYPLHKGTLIGDTLQCGYHGLTFDMSGACIRVPGIDVIPARAQVKAYPVVERYHWVWVWMGDPALADESTVPDFHWLDDPAWGAKGTLLHVKCDYELIIENLLDLTHLTFVHATTIGNMATAEQAQMKFERGGNEVHVNRWMIDTPPPPTYVKAGGFTTNVDRWQLIHYTPPAFVRLYVGAAETGTGAPQAHRVGGIGMRNLNAITPETEKTTHYFWAQAHDFQVNNPAVTEMIFQEILKAFLQDKEVLEAQQQTIDLDPDAPTVNTNHDAGGLEARRILQRLREQEESGARLAFGRA